MHPQEVMELTEVLHSELRLQRSDGVLKESDRRGREHNVIDVEQQVDHMLAATEDEQGCVRLGLRESQGQQVCSKSIVPSTGRLLKSIERLFQAAYMVRKSCILEASRLSTVNCLRESPVQEGVLHVQLMNRPAARECQREHGTNCGRLDNWTEGLVEVHAWALGEAAEDPARLVPFQSSICMELVLEDPLAGDDVGERRARNKIPSLVRQQSVVLSFHSSPPIGIGEGAAEGLRDRRQWSGVEELGRSRTSPWWSCRAGSPRGERARLP